MIFSIFYYSISKQQLKQAKEQKEEDKIKSKLKHSQ